MVAVTLVTRLSIYLFMIFVIRIIIIVKNILIIVLEGTKARIYLCSYYIPWSHLCWRWWGPCFLNLLITVMTIVTYQSQLRWKSQSLTYITYQLKVCLVIQEMSSCPSKKQTLQIKNVQFHLFFMQLSNSQARGCWCQGKYSNRKCALRPALLSIFLRLAPPRPNRESWLSMWPR